MKRTSFSTWPCSIARTVDLLGDWWTPLVLREAYYGVCRFEEIQRALRIGRNILTQRLRRLCDEGMMERVKYQDRPARHEYVLTDKGKDFFPVIAATVRWGDTWLAGKNGPPVLLLHRTCGAETHAEVVCSECQQPLKLKDVEAHLGPGFPARLRRQAAGMDRWRDAPPRARLEVTSRDPSARRARSARSDPPRAGATSARSPSARRGGDRRSPRG